MKRISILWAFALVAFVDATDYCTDITTCSNHVMCEYPNEGPAPNCGRVLARGLTDSEKDIILTKHNYLRNKVARGLETRGAPGPQPPASNLGSLEWDDELETIAQRWVDQCQRTIGGCMDVERFRVRALYGGKAGQRYDETYPVESIVDSWYQNVQEFNSSLVPAVNYHSNLGLVTYTQMVWAATTKLGCGKIVYEDSVKHRKFTRIDFICNYGPKGSIPGEAVYQIATSEE